ncbi:hypothetical protein HID58_095032, partial [Brassica napus]
MESLMSILISSPSLKLLRSPSSRESDRRRFLGNRLKASGLSVSGSEWMPFRVLLVGEDFPLDYEQWLPLTDPDSRRRAGVLLHPTSFRSPHGIGDLGKTRSVSSIGFTLLAAPFGSWFEWPEPLKKNRHLSAMEAIYQSQKEFIDLFIAKQFLFQRQWQKVREYARSKGNRKGFPLLVSGVPPDLSAKLVNCGEAMESEQFSWWVHRIRRAQDLYDECRIDHFRGFAGFGQSLLRCWEDQIIAEDLGVITKDVVELRKSIGAPGMAVLQFAFGGGADNPHLPHIMKFEGGGTLWIKKKNLSNEYLLSIGEEDDISWSLIKAAFSSVAQTAIIPMQDILGLGSSARMNTPATEVGNWGWRIPSSTNFESSS